MRAKRVRGYVWLVAVLLAVAPVTTPAAAQSKDSIDQMADEIIKRALRDALGGNAPPAAPQMPPASSDTTLRVKAGSDAPIPLPEGAEDVELDGPDGKLEFTSKASVASIAAFYRSAMKSLGWRDRPSVINRPNMVVIDFRKDDKSISMTIMQMGPSVNVSARGSGLKTAAQVAQPGPLPSTTPVDLEADEKSGLPFPKNNTQNGTERTPFRIVLTVKTDADLVSVLAFYRRELVKRNWKEEAQGAVANAEQVVLGFTSPDGPAVLKLNRDKRDTLVSLALRKTAEATKAGIVPKAGQSKIVFGSMIDRAAVVTINGKSIKVGAGVGSKAPDGPVIDLPPGKYTVSFRVAAGRAQTETMTIGADETWGFLIGPGGALPLQVY